MYKRIIWNSLESSVITSLEFLDKLVYSSFWELCIHQICGIWSGRDKKNSCWAQDERKRKWMIWGTATMKIVSYNYNFTTVYYNVETLFFKFKSFKTLFFCWWLKDIILRANRSWKMFCWEWKYFYSISYLKEVNNMFTETATSHWD